MRLTANPFPLPEGVMAELNTEDRDFCHDVMAELVRKLRRGLDSNGIGIPPESSMLGLIDGSINDSIATIVRDNQHITGIQS